MSVDGTQEGRRPRQPPVGAKNAKQLRRQHHNCGPCLLCHAEPGSRPARCQCPPLAAQRLPRPEPRRIEKPLRRHLAADRRTPPAAGNVNSMRRSVSPVRQNPQEKCVLIADSLARSTFDLASTCLGALRRQAGGSQATFWACQRPEAVALWARTGRHLVDVGGKEAALQAFVAAPPPRPPMEISGFTCEHSSGIGDLCSHAPCSARHLEDPMAEDPMAYGTKIGSILDPKRVETGTPPVIFQAQVTGFVRLTTPEELKQWEEDLKTYYGLSLDASGLAAGSTCECSCAGQGGRLTSDRTDLNFVLA